MGCLFAFIILAILIATVGLWPVLSAFIGALGIFVGAALITVAVLIMIALIATFSRW